MSAAPDTGRFLVVRSGAERFGLPLAAVREVVDAAPAKAVPSRVGAVRGVMPLHERFFTLVHLGALVAGGVPPEQPAETAVITDVGAARVAFEVDDVEAVVEQGAAQVAAGGGSGAQAASITGVWKVMTGELVAVLDLAVLSARLGEEGGAKA